MGMEIWSPEGERILFATMRDGNSEIYIMDRDGSNATNLSRHPAVDAQPAWSADGRRVVFVSNRDGAEEVYVMDADGGGVKRLTTGGSAVAAPRWQP